jgi:hypothetical protein
MESGREGGREADVGQIRLAGALVNQWESRGQAAAKRFRELSTLLCSRAQGRPGAIGEREEAPPRTSGMDTVANGALGPNDWPAHGATV